MRHSPPLLPPSFDCGDQVILDSIGLARIEAARAHIHLGIAEECPSVRLEHLMIARTALERSRDEIEGAVEVLLVDVRT